MSNLTPTPGASTPVPPGAPAEHWHAMSPASALEKLRTTDQGLTAAEAQARLAQYGPNVLERNSGDGPLKILWNQINNPLIWVLIAAGVVAIAMGKGTDGLVVLAVVVLNTIIGFIQEFKAGKAIEALAAMVPENTTVIRAGEKLVIPVGELVPGDVVTFASGDKVPADLRLISLRNLQIEEAALTGESVPTEKVLTEAKPDASLGDRTSMAFGGTMVTYGTGVGVVVATGQRTELGRISTMLNEATDLETPLTKALGQIGKTITIAIVVVAALMLVIGVYRAMSETGVAFAPALRETVIFAIALAVGAIPEGLPAIVTIALAIGVQRMAARRAIVRKLPAVETLGSTTVICSDKTGTLTRNEMTVQALWTPKSSYEMTGVGYEPVGDLKREGERMDTPTADIRELLAAGVLCNDATIRQEDGRWQMNGDPTEGALVVSAAKVGMGFETMRTESPRLDAIPFESDYQFMATLHRDPLGRRLILMKGAPEVVAKRCAGVDLDTVHGAVEGLANKGMRVLGFAMKTLEEDRDTVEMSDVDGGLTFLGLQGMIDPPRKEAIDAIKACHAAGITVKMITGDHVLTAKAIGQQLGILGTGGAIKGTELSEMSDAQLKRAAMENNVFARVAPEHKLKLVRALQEEGQISAMTGDGVNDAPALKQSNIGVAMGITGTSVTKESADIVLTDDNFASIAAAVEEGRRVYDNLIKSLAFVLPTNLGLAFILMTAVAFFPFALNPETGLKELLLPMLPTQLLWINLVATVALALPLAFEAKEPNVMSRPPRNPDEPVLSKFVMFRTVLAAVLMTLGAVGLFLWERSTSMSAGVPEVMATAKAQTMAVTTVIMFQIFYMLNCRSLRDSILKIGLFSNKTIFVGIAALLVLQAAFIWAPPLQSVFGTMGLQAKDVLLATVVGMVILPVIGIEKLIRGRQSA